jgi:hypothetical protein
VTALIETEGVDAAAVASQASAMSVSVPAEPPLTYWTQLKLLTLTVNAWPLVRWFR